MAKKKKEPELEEMNLSVEWFDGKTGNFKVFKPPSLLENNLYAVEDVSGKQYYFDKNAVRIFSLERILPPEPGPEPEKKEAEIIPMEKPKSKKKKGGKK